MDHNDDLEVNFMNERIERTKLKSLESSRQTVRKLKESEDMAERNVVALAQQSNQITNVEVGIAKVSLNADKAINRTDELKRLQKNFISSALNPGKVIVNWKRKRTIKEEEKKIEMVRRMEITKLSENNSRANMVPHSSKRHDSSYHRDSVAPDETHDIHEQEINRNLSYMSTSVKRLKEMTATMNAELESQNSRLTNTGKDALEMGTRVRTIETRLKKIK
eukprot:NODE_214_length_14327_cov_0.392325.p8 type:complete len:221 gc:universal NODE_214_length_14327_cov_0.392325:2625-3287(+)